MKHLVLLLFIFFSSNYVFANGTCENFFGDIRSLSLSEFEKNEVHTVEYYISKVLKNQKPGITPDFIMPLKEKLKSKLWTGETPKRFFKQTLPKYFKAIDHQLLEAQPGMVKADGIGFFTSIRHIRTWRGKDVSTNVGVNSLALFDNITRDHNYLNRKGSKAVFLFLHGGGTKTTGHHVAVTAMNMFSKYEIDVVSVDEPFHGEGPRVFFSNPLEYFEYLKDFVSENIEPGVPVFVGGHSMGGTYGDAFMRLTDKKEYGFKKVFSGFINLSPVADPHPHLSLKEKIILEEKKEEDKELKSIMAQDDQYLMESLVRSGKTAPLPGLQADSIIFQLNWSIPKHKGEEYLPAITIIGDGDFLYVGNELAYKKYIGDLKNSDLFIIGERVTVEEARTLKENQDLSGLNKEKIGHLIFDHYREGTRELETYLLIREFMEKVLGEKLEAHKVSPTLQNKGVLLKIVQSYFNNIAFREYLKTLVLSIRRSTDEFIDLSKDHKTLIKAIQHLNKSKEDSMALTIEGQEESVYTKSEIEIKKNKIDRIVQSNLIPDGEYKVFAEKNVEKRLLIAKEIGSLVKEKKILKESFDSLSRALKKDKKSFDEEVEKAKKSLGLQNFDNELDQIFTQLMSADKKLRQKNQSLLVELIEEGRLDDSTLSQVPDNILKLYNEYEVIYNEYMAKTHSREATLVNEALRGQLGPSALELAVKLYGPLEKFDFHKLSKGGLMVESESLAERLIALERSILTLNRQKTNLLIDYSDKIISDYFYYDNFFAWDLVNKNLEELGDKSKLMELIWKEWLVLWREKPEIDSISLY